MGQVGAAHATTGNNCNLLGQLAHQHGPAACSSSLPCPKPPASAAAHESERRQVRLEAMKSRNSSSLILDRA